MKKFIFIFIQIFTLSLVTSYNIFSMREYAQKYEKKYKKENGQELPKLEYEQVLPFDNDILIEKTNTSDELIKLQKLKYEKFLTFDNGIWVAKTDITKLIKERNLPTDLDYLYEKEKNLKKQELTIKEQEKSLELEEKTEEASNRILTQRQLENKKKVLDKQKQALWFILDQMGQLEGQEETVDSILTQNGQKKFYELDERKINQLVNDIKSKLDSSKELEEVKFVCMANGEIVETSLLNKKNFRKNIKKSLIEALCKESQKYKSEKSKNYFRSFSRLVQLTLPVIYGPISYFTIISTGPSWYDPLIWLSTFILVKKTFTQLETKDYTFELIKSRYKKKFWTELGKLEKTVEASGTKN